MEDTPDEFTDVSDVDGGAPDSIAVEIGRDKPLNLLINDFVDERVNCAPSSSAPAPAARGSVMGNVAKATDDEDEAKANHLSYPISLIQDGTVIASTVTDSIGDYK